MIGTMALDSWLIAAQFYTGLLQIGACLVTTMLHHSCVSMCVVNDIHWGTHRRDVFMTTALMTSGVFLMLVRYVQNAS